MRVKIVKPLMRVWINGLEGTYKTSLALYIYFKIFARRGYELVYAPPHVSINDVEEHLKQVRSNAVYIVFDDLTYKYHSLSTEFREFASKMMTIRHWAPQRYFVVVYISHYSRSVPPALRQAHVIAFTSLTTLEEYNIAKSYFKQEYLDFFFSTYPKRRLILMNWFGRCFLMTPPPHIEPPREKTVRERLKEMVEELRERLRR
ncbi:MAG: hypothetical protein QW512_02020, partial [Thermofilaceae archaeon]